MFELAGPYEKFNLALLLPHVSTSLTGQVGQHLENSRSPASHCPGFQGSVTISLFSSGIWRQLKDRGRKKTGEECDLGCAPWAPNFVLSLGLRCKVMSLFASLAVLVLCHLVTVSL